MTTVRKVLVMLALVVVVATQGCSYPSRAPVRGRPPVRYKSLTGGQVVRLGANASFVVPQGWSGRWSVEESTTGEAAAVARILPHGLEGAALSSPDMEEDHIDLRLLASDKDAAQLISLYEQVLSARSEDRLKAPALIRFSVSPDATATAAVRWSDAARGPIRAQDALIVISRSRGLPIQVLATFSPDSSLLTTAGAGPEVAKGVLSLVRLSLQ